MDNKTELKDIFFKHERVMFASIFKLQYIMSLEDDYFDGLLTEYQINVGDYCDLKEAGLIIGALVLDEAINFYIDCYKRNIVNKEVRLFNGVWYVNEECLFGLPDKNGLKRLPIEFLTSHRFEFDISTAFKDKGKRWVSSSYIHQMCDVKKMLSVPTIRAKKEKKEDLIKTDDRPTKTYLMIDESNGLIKIGKSFNPFKREKTLRSDTPKLRLIATLDENKERELHVKYKKQRVRGEWFDLTSDQMLDLINNFGFKFIER